MAVWKSIRLAIERFDKAAQEYAFRGTHSGSPRYGEIITEYHDARIHLNDAIDKALGTSFRDGQSDAYSRAANRPGDGDMGG